MNAITYFEIQSSTPQRDIEFSNTAFGWTFERVDAAPVEYYMITTENLRGGLMERPAKVPPQEHGTNAFICSIEVDSFDETAKKILDAGGIVAMEKFPLPGRGWMGYFMDADNNAFGVFEEDTEVE